MAEELTKAVREHERATMTEVREELVMVNEQLTVLIATVQHAFKVWDETRLKGPK